MTAMTRLLVVFTFPLLASSLANSQTSPEIVGPPTTPAAGEKFPLPTTDRPNVGGALPRTTGSLAIQAVQGTPGGPAIGAIDVEVQLLHRGTLVDTIKSQLDEHGVVVLDNIPISMGVQPVVRVQHADLTYQVAGGLMDASHPEQKLEVVCHEPTDQQPQWKISMHHVMIAMVPDGLKVTEVVVVENPDNKTWVGAPSVKNKRATTSFALPAGAKDVTLGAGFHDWCCTTVAGGNLINHLPLMPGQTEMVYGYIVPSQDGKATVDMFAPATVDHLMVLVPDSAKADSFGGLDLGGTQTMGNESVRYYMASNLSQGQRASITLTGLTSVAAASSGSSSTVAKIIAVVGGGLILLLALAIMFARKPAHARRSAARVA